MTTISDQGDQMDHTKIIDMKKSLYFLFFFIFFYSCRSQEITQRHSDEILDIIFASGFSSDNIELIITKTSIVKLKLYSDRADGVTTLRVKLISDNKVLFVKTSTIERIFVLNHTEEIIIEVLVNNIKYVYRPIADKGRYIIVNLESGITFHQQVKEPFFD